MNTFRIATALGIVALASTSFATNWVWDWNGGNAYNNEGGTINSIHAEFNDATNRFVWRTNFGDNPDGKETEGYWLAVSPGPNPKGHAGELAIYYFDAGTASPTLTVYAYNGVNGNSSYKDGSNQSGTQAPDKILSSQLTQNWINALTVVNEANGTRTFTIDIDATEIQNHMPLYPGPGGQAEWTGTAFAQKLGLWFHPVTGISTQYNNGFLSDFKFKDQGWFDGSNFTTVPEPGTMIALGAGLAALAARRRRK